MKLAERQPYLWGNKFDPETKTRTYMVGIRCKKCTREEWHSAPSPGWGRRVFKNKGWVCGNGPGQHICPKCDEMRKTGKARGYVEAAQVEYEADATAALAPPPPPAPATPRPIEAAPAGALAEALAPLKAEIAREQTVKTSRGLPTGYAVRSSAANAARRTLAALGVTNPYENEHYRVVAEPGGTFGYVLIGAALSSAAVIPPAPKKAPKSQGHLKALWARLDAAGPFPEDQRGVKIPSLPGGHKRPTAPGDIKDGTSAAKRSAEAACARFGIENAELDKHYRLHWVGSKATYSFIEAAVPFRESSPKAAPPAPKIAPPQPAPTPKPIPLKGGGYLSRWNARKAAISAIQPVKKTPGAPSEGVDYWLTQDSHNYWLYTTEPPSAVSPPQPEPQQETAVSDGSTQGVRDAEDMAKAAPIRTPDFADKRRIREALDEHYDEASGYWRGELSDHKAAELLKVPRAWVTQVRDIYGPDRNRAEDLKREAELAAKRARINEAAELAETALSLSNVVIETAAKLETVMAELKLKRQELGL